MIVTILLSHTVSVLEMYNDLFRIVYLLSVLSQLADCYLSAGEAAGAIKIYEECVETFRKHLPDTLLNLCTGESHFTLNGLSTLSQCTLIAQYYTNWKSIMPQTVCYRSRPLFFKKLLDFIDYFATTFILDYVNVHKL